MSKYITLALIAVLAIASYTAAAQAADTEGHDAHGDKAHAHDEADGHDKGGHDAHSEQTTSESGGHGHEGGHDHGDASYSVGQPAVAADADRTVEVVMSDAMTYTFSPDLENIGDGEVINFLVTNSGKINHEFSIGNQADQVEHAAMMLRMPNMVHDDPNTVTVAPGESKSLAWKFSGDDLVVFACNVPGHYQAGMFKKSTITGAEQDGHSDHSH